MTQKGKILIISGSTASGKSALAKMIAIKANGVIINADSMQIYKELPILSAQPNQDDLTDIEYFLYSRLKYNQESSVAIWLELVLGVIDKAVRTKKLPIIVGGTGFYISSLINGISKIPKIDEEIKQASRQTYEVISREEFIETLVNLGEKREKIAMLDKQRLIRHLEILKQTGKSISWWHEQSRSQCELKNYIHVNLEPDREKLYQNCNQRFEQMLENGAIQEVKKFMKLKPNSNLSITKTIGYLEIRDYLHNIITKEELLKKSCQKTRNYAKRQLTWFKNQFKNKIIFKDANNKAAINQILTLLNK